MNIRYNVNYYDKNTNKLCHVEKGYKCKQEAVSDAETYLYGYFFEISDWQVGDRIIRIIDQCLVVEIVQYSQDGVISTDSIDIDETCENIDATLRAKDREIAELKVQLAENNAENDPWCYDLSKAPKRDDFLVCDEDYVFQTACISPITKKIFIYEKAERMKFIPIAWMSIPEPKGGSDEQD